MSRSYDRPSARKHKRNAVDSTGPPLPRDQRAGRRPRLVRELLVFQQTEPKIKVVVEHHSERVDRRNRGIEFVVASARQMVRGKDQVLRVAGQVSPAVI